MIVPALATGSPEIWRIGPFLIQPTPLSNQDMIQIVAAMIAFGAFFAAFWFSRRSRTDSLRVEKSTAYLNLEVASSEIFQHEAEKSPKIAAYRTVYVTDADRARLMDGSANAVICYNLYFQTLNLFEVCSRFRRQDVIEHEVFASWVAWFYDTLDDWYFREMWHDFRGNYTDDVRAIFDMGVILFEGYGTSHPGDEEAEEARDRARKDAFYRMVGDHMQCEEIKGWLNKTRAIALAPPPMPGRLGKWAIRNGWSRRPLPTTWRVSSPEPLPATPAISAMVRSSAD